MPQDSLEELHPLLDLEQRLLVGVPEDGHDHPLEVPGRPLDDVDMAVGGRIEGAGAEGEGHLRLLVWYLFRPGRPQEDQGRIAVAPPGDHLEALHARGCVRSPRLQHH